jgi:hypothetical protein
MIETKARQALLLAWMLVEACAQFMVLAIMAEMLHLKEI